MYSGDEFYDDEITSGLTERAPRPVYPPHNCGPLGTVQCHGCGHRVDVAYTYTNSKVMVGIVDHQDGDTERRCVDAGRTLIYHGQWLGGSGYSTEEIAFSVPVATIQGASL